MRKKIPRVAMAIIGCVAVVSATVPSAVASSHPEVKTCNTGTNCTTAAFAVCLPTALPNCSPGRTVDIRVYRFTPNQTNGVHVWFLASEVDNPRKTDCSQLLLDAAVTKYHLGDISTDNSGNGVLSSVTLPPGQLGEEWNYGPNWTCATEAPHSGGSGKIADRIFTVYPF